MEVAGLPSAWCACPALAAGRAEHLRGDNSVMNINEVAQQAAIVLPVYDLQIRIPGAVCHRVYALMAMRNRALCDKR